MVRHFCDRCDGRIDHVTQDHKVHVFDKERELCLTCMAEFKKLCHNWFYKILDGSHGWI